jgi:tryptophan-rich sensory protein
MIQKISNLSFFILMVVMNYLANALPINGKTTGDLSDAYPNLFVPAGITFSIWAVIYLMLLLFVLLQFRESNRESVQQLGWLFAISCILNSLWIVAWHYQWLLLSLVIMLGLLVTLVVINISLKQQPLSITKASFGIYLGWICIATIANVTALLVSYGWGGWGLSPQVWTILLIAIGASIVLITQVRLSNPFIGLAVVWAFLGIAIKRESDFQSIFYMAIAAMVVVGLFTVFQFVRGRVY